MGKLIVHIGTAPLLTSSELSVLKGGVWEVAGEQPWSQSLGGEHRRGSVGGTLQSKSPTHQSSATSIPTHTQSKSQVKQLKTTLTEIFQNAY